MPLPVDDLNDFQQVLCFGPGTVFSEQSVSDEECLVPSEFSAEEEGVEVGDEEAGGLFFAAQVPVVESGILEGDVADEEEVPAREDLEGFGWGFNLCSRDFFDVF